MNCQNIAVMIFEHEIATSITWKTSKSSNRFFVRVCSSLKIVGKLLYWLWYHANSTKYLKWHLSFHISVIIFAFIEHIVLYFSYFSYFIHKFKCQNPHIHLCVSRLLAKWKTIQTWNLAHILPLTLSENRFFVFSKKSPWRPLATKNCCVTWIFRISPPFPCPWFPQTFFFKNGM